MRKRVEFIESYIKIDGSDYQWNDNHGVLIRCEDCVHFTGLNESKTWGRCNAHGRTAQDIDYCSWAERRDDCER